MNCRTGIEWLHPVATASGSVSASTFANPKLTRCLIIVVDAAVHADHN